MENVLAKVNGLNLFKHVVDLAKSSSFVSLRYSSKGGRPPNKGGKGRPKHRRVQKNDGTYVTQGTILATQYQIRHCPGLNVGAGRFGVLYAQVHGRVVVSCEKAELDENHSYIKKWYPDRKGVMYKKYFNIIPEQQHNRFKLIDQI